MIVPETLKGELEDIDVLFETNPTWLIGPGSRKKLAQIITDREAGDAEVKGEKNVEPGASVEVIENKL